MFKIKNSSTEVVTLEIKKKKRQPLPWNFLTADTFYILPLKEFSIIELKRIQNNCLNFAASVTTCNLQGLADIAA